MYKFRWIFSIVITCLSLSSPQANASSNKHLWPVWQVTNPVSQKEISHWAFQSILDRLVITNSEGINLINYEAMTKADKEALCRYIHQLSSIDIGNYNRSEQLAYWLNLYNALTIEMVSKYYPLSSIQNINISPGLFNIGPWGANIITINGKDLSLEDIHNRIIRPIWNDPRTHYAIHNATIGSANIQKNVFKGRIINSQLNQAAKTYINSLRGVQIIGSELVLSKIYVWFKEDFGGSEPFIIKHIMQYADSKLKTSLKNIHKVATYHYNWHLNATPINNEKRLKQS